MTLLFGISIVFMAISFLVRRPWTLAVPFVVALFAVGLYLPVLFLFWPSTRRLGLAWVGLVLICCVSWASYVTVVLGSIGYTTPSTYTMLTQPGCRHSQWPRSCMPRSPRPWGESKSGRINCASKPCPSSITSPLKMPYITIRRAGFPFMKTK